MSQNPPWQDLEATDLHNNKWVFRHIFRGQNLTDHETIEGAISVVLEDLISMLHIDKCYFRSTEAPLIDYWMECLC